MSAFQSPDGCLLTPLDRLRAAILIPDKPSGGGLQRTVMKVADLVPDARKQNPDAWWLDELYVRLLTLEERIAFEVVWTPKTTHVSWPFLVVLSTCDADGNPVFPYMDKKEKEQQIETVLKTGDAVLTGYLWDAAAQLNCYRERNIQELVKNSTAAEKTASDSLSVSSSDVPSENSQVESDPKST